MTTNVRRWGDNDRSFGPFTYARDGRSYRPIAVVISSGDDEYPGCSARLSGFGHTFIVELPLVIKPFVSWVDLSDQEWASLRPDGRKGYTRIDKREYGFSLSDGFLNVSLGRVTYDSQTERGWFKWLSIFRRSKVSRCLELTFSAETGKHKGSWKGGTIGHAIEMRPGELHEQAFRRYCAEHEMTFVGAV